MQQEIVPDITHEHLPKMYRLDDVLIYVLRHHGSSNRDRGAALFETRKGHEVYHGNVYLPLPVLILHLSQQLLHEGGKCLAILFVDEPHTATPNLCRNVAAAARRRRSSYADSMIQTPPAIRRKRSFASSADRGSGASSSRFTRVSHCDRAMAS